MTDDGRPPEARARRPATSGRGGVYTMTATVIMIMDLSRAGRWEQKQYVDCTRFSDCG
jgi:hypothetical protein